MRQVFSSARIENAESVARMLEGEGIEVRIEHGRSFRSAIRGNFSYRQGAEGPRPSVWVIRSEDQPRARQLLRETGLLDADTTLPSRFLPQTPHAAMRERDAAETRRRSARLRFGLLALIAIVAAAVVFKPRPDDTPAVAARPAIDPALDAFATATETVHLIATPPALAAAVATLEHGRERSALCLGVDGEDPPAAALDALRAGGIEAMPASACNASLRVDVYAWRTDGSGSGTVTWSVGRDGAQARVRSATARRDGDDWQVDAAP